MDKATWLGIIIGFGCILLGNLIEGGHINSLMQFTAFMIVLGGTIGAVLVANKSQHLKIGMRLVRKAFFEEQLNQLQIGAKSIVEMARFARKETLLSLAPKLNSFPSSFVNQVVQHLIEGLTIDQVREIFEAKIEIEEEHLLAGAKIWTDAGGFAPTIGIIGAVLGLIHVMGNLSDTSKLGAGIAVAFVATVYGVSFANMLFLPLGMKLKGKVEELVNNKRILLDGALLIGSDLNPIILEQKLGAYLNHHEIQ